MNWKTKIEQYCDDYNIPIEYLADTLNDPKVIPMIRGKAFEFSVMIMLNNLLPSETWRAEKPILNPQLGSHDKDVVLTHLPTGKTVNIECKLAGKGKFTQTINGSTRIAVKCMRSRTLGAEMVADLAPKRGVAPEVLAIHNDQYMPADFDVVITSISNAFYQTNDESGFEWKPTPKQIQFLQKLNNDKSISDKDFAFFRMYAASSLELAVRKENGVVCTRKKCRNKEDCGFIPNYPIMEFASEETRPIARWLPLEDSEKLFLRVIHRK
ncbi:MAG: restriction endonuclease [Candidatus Kapaibacterium sp.]|nr:MAG: restriction endonuclease [Candidatus Kapabacteria bacterium]